jgi:hypothetical protein
MKVGACIATILGNSKLEVTMSYNMLQGLGLKRPHGCALMP